MKNNKKIIIFIIIISLILLLVGFLLFNFDKKKNNDTDVKEVIQKDGYDEFGNKLLVYYDDKDDVYNVIVKDYLDKNETLEYVEEINGCWFYIDSSGDEYRYCADVPVIDVLKKDTINLESLIK